MPERGHGLNRVIALLPALVALGLASLYGIGAMLETAQIQDAGLTVRDTLPLFPLEQLLGRGIGTVVLASATAAGAALILAFAPAIERKIDAAVERRGAKTEGVIESAEHEIAAGDPERARQLLVRARERMRRQRRSRRGSIVCNVALTVVALVFLPPVFAAGLLVLLGGGLAVLYRAVVPPRLTTFMGGVYAGFVVLVLVQAFVDPEPLARAELVLTSGQEIRGELVVSTADQWVLATAERQLRIIPADQVTEARVAQREETRESVLELVTGWDL